MSKENNFNLLRTLAASLVIISHSFALLQAGPDPLANLTNNNIHFSELGLWIFFVISGYLITASQNNTPNPISFIWKRILRLIPGLFVALLFGAYVLGPLVTTLSIKSYLLSKDTLLHLKSLTLYFPSYKLPGVFTNHPFTSSINGSLWTLPYEFTLYVFIVVLYIIPNKKTLFLFIPLLVFFILLEYLGYATYFPPLNIGLFFLGKFGVLFIAGALIYSFQIDQKIKTLSNSMVMIIFLVGVFTCYYTSIFLYLLSPIIILHIGLQKSYISRLNKLGDPSYGIYIYAFPIQQSIIHFFPSINVYTHIFSSWLIAVLFGYLSWHIIEKKMLQLKNLL